MTRPPSEKEAALINLSLLQLSLLETLVPIDLRDLVPTDRYREIIIVSTISMSFSLLLPPRSTRKKEEKKKRKRKRREK